MTKHSKVHFVHDDGMPACGKAMSRLSGGSALWQDVTCQLCKETIRQAEKVEEGSKALLEAVGSKKVTLYTLAPASLDKPGTESVGSYWLYASETVPEQALREVIIPKGKSAAQWQLYSGLVDFNSNEPLRGKIPYITFTEIQLGKALARGEVYPSDEQVELIKTMVEADNNNQKEVDMPRRKIEKMPARTQRVQDMRQEPLTVEYVETRGKDIAEMEKPTASALDAILAQPIAAPLVDIDGAALVNPSGDAPARIRVDGEAESTIAFDSRLYVMFVRAFKQALREEGLVIVPASTMLIPAAPEALAAPMVKDTLGDAWGDFLPVSEPVVPAKRVSTLKVFASQPVEKTVRASSVDDKTIAAIRADYLNKRMTQAALARKYDISSQKVWHIVTGK